MITLDKNEYQYYAAKLITGERSSYMDFFSIYGAMPLFSDVTYIEEQGADYGGRMDIIRTAHVNRCSIVTWFLFKSTEIASLIELRFQDHDIVLHDALFREDPNGHYVGDDLILGKIRDVGLLIQAVREKSTRMVPLLINQFPYISRAILKAPVLLAT